MMSDIDNADEQRLEDIARRHGFSVGATRTMFDAVVGGNGSMAQFSHPEFGGSGQWMRGGMTMIGDMFNGRLKAAVDALCVDLANLAANRSEPARRSSSFQSQSQTQLQGGRGSNAADGGCFVSPAGQWWPGDLGAPNASGAQNGSRYAYFADARRLAIEGDGGVTVYDTGDHRIGGVAQQQSGTSRMSFASQWGPVDVDRLPIVSQARGSNPEKRPGPAAAVGVGESNGPIIGAREVPGLLEKLAALHEKGVLTGEEFGMKKAELLRRL